MCLSPNKLSDGTLVGCRECWQCRERKVDDWVGRCIAESKTATATHSITLTYGGELDQYDDVTKAIRTDRMDHLRAALLTYSDVQKYFKRLRRNGYELSYIVVGEYGSTKGRAHWHLIVFWQGKVPAHELEKRFEEEHWPHGVSWWEKPTPAAIRYVCKYIQKDIGADQRQGHLSMSKKPPLGAKYFRRLARQYVDQGLAPQDLYYSFPESQRNGRVIDYMLPPRSASADLFCAAYLDQWNAIRGGFCPASPLIEEYVDRMTPENLELRYARVAGRVPVPFAPPPGGEKPIFSEIYNCYYSKTPYGRLFWSTNSDGDLVWHEKIGPNVSLEKTIEAVTRNYRDVSRGL